MKIGSLYEIRVMSTIETHPTWRESVSHLGQIICR